MAEALVVCEERGDGFEVFAVRMFQGLARANQGRMSEALADLEQARGVRGPQRRPLLAAAPREPAGLDPSRARRRRAGPRARRAGARAGAREPLALDARGRRAPEPVRRRRARGQTPRAPPTCSPMLEDGTPHARLVPLDERAAPRGRRDRSTTRRAERSRRSAARAARLETVAARLGRPQLPLHGRAARGPRSRWPGGGDCPRGGSPGWTRARRAARPPGSARDAGSRGACWGCCGCAWATSAPRAPPSRPPPPTSTRSCAAPMSRPCARASSAARPCARCCAQAGRA